MVTCLLAVSCAGGPESSRDSSVPSGHGHPGEKVGAGVPPGSSGDPAAAPGTSGASGTDLGGASGADLVIARVDGTPLFAGDAFRLLFLSAPDETANSVRQLVVDRLAAGEARQVGVTVPAATIERELERLLSEQERKVKEASKGAQDLAGFVKTTYRLERAEYVAIVRASLERSLLLERLILFELGRHPRVQLRLIRVKEKALAEEILRKVGLGADFTVLARQHSEDASARDGGIYPPLPSDLESPLIAKTVGLEAGVVSPIDEVSTGDGPRYRIMQVLARLPAESGTWGERAAAIEQVLDGRAIAPLELEAWMRIVEQRHEVRLLGMGTRDDGP